jgi:heat shock protein HslJ
MVKRVPVMPFVVGLATLLVVVLAACDAVGASPEGETPEPIGSAGLESSTWAIQSIGAITLGPDAGATLSVEPGGRVSGETGCNRYTGEVSVDGAALTFGPLATTRMACEPPRMEQERAVLDALAGVTGWSVDEGGRLHLTGATELVLVARDQ